MMLCPGEVALKSISQKQITSNQIKALKQKPYYHKNQYRHQRKMHYPGSSVLLNKNITLHIMSALSPHIKCAPAVCSAIFI